MKANDVKTDLSTEITAMKGESICIDPEINTQGRMAGRAIKKIPRDNSEMIRFAKTLIVNLTVFVAVFALLEGISRIIGKPFVAKDLTYPNKDNSGELQSCPIEEPLVFRNKSKTDPNDPLICIEPNHVIGKYFNASSHEPEPK